MATRKRIGESLKRSVGLVVDAAADGFNLVLPGTGTVGKLLYGSVMNGRRRRVESMFQRLLTGAQALPEEECRKALEDEPMCTEAVLQLLQDEEGEKAWAYAALFRAFARDMVRPPERVRYLRCLRELTLEELKGLPQWNGYSAAEVVGPYVNFRIVFENGHREWFVQPEVKQEEAPHVVESLCRWGFLRRMHERGELSQMRIGGPKTLPTPFTLPARRPHAPIPGKTKLEVNPDLALFFFIFTERPREKARDLGRPMKLQVEIHGTFENLSARGLTTKDFQPPLGGRPAPPAGS